MALPNIFTPGISEQIINRINKLTADTPPKWGKMSASQMLAHCNVPYEIIYTDKHPKPNFLMKMILKSLVKKSVTNEVPYKQNLRTAPAFLIKDERNFGSEKRQLIDYINKTVELGEKHFENKASHSFGKLSSVQWNNMFYKHLDHHLQQFGI